MLDWVLLLLLLLLLVVVVVVLFYSGCSAIEIDYEVI